MSVGVSGKFLFAISPLLCAVFAPLHPAVAQSLRGLRYEDPKTGFRIPRDYSQIPVQQDERWIVAMFQSKKAFTGSVKDRDSGFGRKPMLKVILFDQDAIARSSTVELQGGSTITTDRGVPYRDYRDYAKRNLTAGGYYLLAASGQIHTFGDITTTPDITALTTKVFNTDTLNGQLIDVTPAGTGLCALGADGGLFDMLGATHNTVLRAHTNPNTTAIDTTG